MTDLDEVQKLLDGVTPGPWTLCAHLRLPDENGCTCGYRGVIFAGETEYAICQPGHEVNRGEEGLEPPRFDRPTEIANARFIAASRSWVPDMASEIAALRAEIARLTAERDAAKDWPKEEVAPGQWVDVDPESLARAALIPAPDTLRQVREAAGRAERAQALRDALAAFDREAKGHVYIGGQKFRTAKLDDVAPAILAMIPEGV